jgi:hypothetical protein
MLRKILTLTFIAMFAFAPHAFADDVQLWLTLKTKNKFHKAVSLQLDNELRLKNKVSEVGYIHSEVGLVFHPQKVKWLNLEIGGRFVLSPKKPKVLEAWTGGWQFRPSLGITFKVPFRDLAKLSNRTKVEFHVNEEGLSQWRARNLTTATAKVWSKGDKAVDLALSEEFFLVTTGVNENRLRGGFEFWVTKNAGLSVFYQWQAQLNVTLSSIKVKPDPSLALKEESNWNHAHGVGAAGLLKF